MTVSKYIRPPYVGAASCRTQLARPIRLCGAFLILIAAVPTGRADVPLTLVDEKTSATVVLPSDAEESTKLAACELTNYVAKVTGRVLKVGDANGSSRIVIGTLATLRGLPKSIAERLNATDDREAACLATIDNALWIVGKRNVAELYATYHFIEKELGVRWFQAPVKDDPGEYVPKRATIVVKPFAEFRKPAFVMRRLDAVGCTQAHIARNAVSTAIRNGYQVFPPFGGRFDEKGTAWYRFWAPRVESDRLGVASGGHMTFQGPIPVKKYFATHPEYFALVDGKRVASGEFIQYCLSNPEVRQIVAEDIIAHFDKTNGEGAYSFGMTDSHKGSCMCANCRALDDVPINKSAHPDVSGRYFKTITDIASRVWKKWPNADLRTWAYDIYYRIPKDVQFDPRLYLQFCTHNRCVGHRLDDPRCARNAEALPFIREWHKVAPKMGLYDYTEDSTSWYMCRTMTEANDLKIYRDMGLVGWKNEAHFSDAFHWPRGTPLSLENRSELQPSNWQWLYVTGHLLWNPDLDARAMLDEAESLYYGPAYPAMKQYHDLRRKIWDNNRNCLGWPQGNSRLATLLNVPGAKEELLGYLDEAEKLAGATGIYRRRVGLDRKWLKRWWIEPNDKVRAKAGKAFHAVRATTPIVIDGKDDEGAWAGAFYTDDLHRVYAQEKGPIDDAHKMTYGILRDDENLYFFIRAKESDMVNVKPSPSGEAWDADGVEIFLYPPSKGNRTYHIATNPDGTVWAAQHPGKAVPDKLGILAVGTMGKDAWTIEMRVPAKDVYPLVEGETWKVLFAATRGGKHYSSDGDYFDTSNYRPMEIGNPYMKNGSFGRLNAKGNPEGWDMHGKYEIVKLGVNNAVNFLNGYMTGCMAHGKLSQSDKPRKLKYAIRAKGPGKLSVAFGHYIDTYDQTVPHGYTRDYKPPEKRTATYALTDDETLYTGEHTVQPNMWDCIVIYGSNATVYSVAVTPL